MKAYFIICCLGLSIVICLFYTFDRPPNYVSIEQRDRESTVAILIDTWDFSKCKSLGVVCEETEGTDSCSGVVVGSEQTNTDLKLRVITAKHCSESTEGDNPTDIRAVTYYGDIGFLGSTYADKVNDIEILTFIFSSVAKPVPVAVFSNSPPYPGDQLTVVGSPDDYMWKIQKFEYQGQSLDFSHPRWKYDAEMLGYCGEGDSGAGVWNEDGKLVGDLNAGDSRFCYFLPSGRFQSYD